MGVPLVSYLILDGDSQWNYSRGRVSEGALNESVSDTVSNERKAGADLFRLVVLSQTQKNCGGATDCEMQNGGG